MDDNSLNKLLKKRKFEPAKAGLEDRIIAASLQQKNKDKTSNNLFFFIRRAAVATFAITFIGIALSYNLPSEISSSEPQSMEEFLLMEDILN